MKITRQDANTFELKTVNIGFVVGPIFLVFGLLALMGKNAEIPLWFPLIFIGIGVLVTILPTADRITFNKSENTFAFDQKGLAKEAHRMYELNKIRSVELIPEWSRNRRNPSLMFRLVCRMEGGENVVLNPNFSTMTRVSVGPVWKRVIPEEKIGEQLALFLDVPFESRRPPSIGEGVIQ